MKTYNDLLTMAGRTDEEVVLAVRVGSHVYGTAHEGSDEDYVMVVKRGKDDLLFKDGCNVTIRSSESFMRALEEHNIFTLECLFAPKEHTLKATKVFKWQPNWAGIAVSAIAKSTSDFLKATRGEMDAKNKKRLWHSVRVLTFARQLQVSHAITDYGAENEMYWDVMTDPSGNPDDYVNKWGPVRDQRLSQVETKP